MNAPYDKNGKILLNGSYVKFQNSLWEVCDWDGHYNLPQSKVWLEPRAENESPALWANSTTMELTNMSQLYFEL